MPKADYRMKKNERLYTDYMVYTPYNFADGNQQLCLNADKLCLLINYKANTQSTKNKSLENLFFMTTGLTLSYFDAFLFERLNNYAKGKNEKYEPRKYLFSMFLEESLSNKSVNKVHFKNLYEDINKVIQESDYVYPFKVALIELTKSLAPDLYEEHFSKTFIGENNGSRAYLSIIREVLNESIEIARSYREVCESNNLQKRKNYIDLLYKNNEKLFSLKNHVFWGVDLKVDLFKKDLNSKEKGDIGEFLFSGDVAGEVVGHLGEKVDVKSERENYSIKTSYSSSWNNHLAYFHNNDFYDKFKETSRVSTISKEDGFDKLLISFFLGDKKEVDTLVLQKVKMDELNRSVAEGTAYKIPMSFIEDTIKNKSYFLNGSDLIMVHDGEQFMKLNFKERSNKGQIMLIVTVDNMEQLFEKGIVEKKEIGCDFSKPKRKSLKMV